MNRSDRYIGIIGLILVLCLLFVSGCETLLGPQFMRFPDIDELPDVNELPDPFITAIGGRVRNKAEWCEHREELKQMMLHYQYGHIPPPPFEVSGKVLSSAVTFDGAAIKKTRLNYYNAKEKIPLRRT